MLIHLHLTPQMPVVISPSLRILTGKANGPNLGTSASAWGSRTEAFLGKGSRYGCETILVAEARLHIARPGIGGMDWLEPMSGPRTGRCGRSRRDQGLPPQDGDQLADPGG